MDPNTQTQPQVQNGGQQSLPNATAVLVLGILSIALCWCYGIPGITMGIIALVLANKSTKMYTANSGAYTESSFKNMKAGKICAIIGTSLSGLYLIFIIVYLSILGVALGSIFSTMPWENFK